MSSTAQASEKPIIFSGPMVQAILDGRKTQTRRVVKQVNCTGQDRDLVYKSGRVWASLSPDELSPDDPDKTIFGGDVALFDKTNCYTPVVIGGGLGKPLSCPYSKVGTHLWVRETWADKSDWDHFNRLLPDAKAIWKATDENAPVSRWRPSIHMPRWASRITLEVTEVRVERLAEISEDDAVAEGFALDGCGGEGPVNTLHRSWNTLNAKRGYSWESNPFVWVIEFKRVKP